MNAGSIQGVLVGSVLAAEEQLPEDVGKSGPIGLFLLLVLLVVDGQQHERRHGHDTLAEVRTPANRSSSGTGESTSERASS